MLCPHCGYAKIHYSHRWYWERLLILLLLRPYRCENCQSRFWGISGRY
jgi:DNA-directed RNA polymerase subunit RPC12/RpoP